YPARLMTGRAAAGRQGYKDAVTYLDVMIKDTNCPPALNAQAQFTLGLTLMSFESSDTNNSAANFAAATNVFGRLAQAAPAGGLSLPAQVRIGDCNLQMNNFDAATNVYAAVFNSTNADIALRSEAQVGFGLALEKKSELAAADDKRKLQHRALQN